MKCRPRFSVRTLVILVTLLSAYFGVWEATKRYARTFSSLPGTETIFFRDGRQVTLTEPVMDEAENINPEHLSLLLETARSDCFVIRGALSPGPFVLTQYEVDMGAPAGRRRYYLWFFGPKFKLPFESEWRQ